MRLIKKLDLDNLTATILVNESEKGIREQIVTPIPIDKGAVLRAIDIDEDRAQNIEFDVEEIAPQINLLSGYTGSIEKLNKKFKNVYEQNENGTLEKFTDSYNHYLMSAFESEAENINEIFKDRYLGILDTTFDLLSDNDGSVLERELGLSVMYDFCDEVIDISTTNHEGKSYNVKCPFTIEKEIKDLDYMFDEMEYYYFAVDKLTEKMLPDYETSKN